MGHNAPRQIDMMIDGRFISTPRSSWPMRVAGVAIVVAVVAGAIGIAALALWIATMLIPIALVAALVAWATLRFQAWRKGGSARRDLYRR